MCCWWPMAGSRRWWWKLSPLAEWFRTSGRGKERRNDEISSCWERSVVTWKKKKKQKKKKVSKCFKCDANSLFRPPLDSISATLSSRELDEGFRCKVDEATLSYPCIFSVRDKTFPVSSSFWSFACQVDVSCWSFERHPEWCCPWIRGCSHEDHEPYAIPCHPMPSHAIPNGLPTVRSGMDRLGGNAGGRQIICVITAARSTGMWRENHGPSPMTCAAKCGNHW